jgi:hypothetical protein
MAGGSKTRSARQLRLWLRNLNKIAPWWGSLLEEQPFFQQSSRRAKGELKRAFEHPKLCLQEAQAHCSERDCSERFAAADFFDLKVAAARRAICRPEGE